MSTQSKQKRTITIELPGEFGEEAISAFARLQRSRVRAAAQQQNRTLDDSVDKTSDEDIATQAIRTMILSAYEREVTQEAIKKIRAKY